MKRFVLEFMLTSLVFAHILFGIIWYRARANLRQVVADAARQNRVLLAAGEEAAYRGETGVREYPTPEAGGELESEVEECLVRLLAARERNDLATIEKEIARLIAMGARIEPLLRQRFDADAPVAEKLFLALVLAKIAEKDATENRFLSTTVLPYLEGILPRLVHRRDFSLAFRTAAAIGSKDALKWVAGTFSAAERGDVKHAALIALVEKGSEASENTLFGLLESSRDLIDRRRVAGIFLEYPGKKRAPKVLELLNRNPPLPVSTRILLAGLLGAMSEAGAEDSASARRVKQEIPFLASMVRSRRTQALRRDALQALVRIWGPEAEFVISEVVSDSGQPTGMRVTAGKALAERGRVSAMEPLVSMLDSRDPKARVGACEALITLGSKAENPDVKDALEEKVVPALKAMLMARETAYARNAAVDLASIGSTGARDALIDLAKSAPANHARIQVVRSLGSFADEEVVDALTEVSLSDGISPQLKRAAEETLAKVRQALEKKNP